MNGETTNAGRVAAGRAEGGVVTRLVTRLDGFFDDEGSVRALCLLRALLGPVVFLHLLPFLSEMSAGRYYADHFWSPWFSWLPVPDRHVYFGVLGLGVLAAVFMTLGVLARPSTWIAFSVVAWNFFLSETHFRHNRNFLLVVLFGLCLLPVGARFSVDALLERTRTGALPRDRAYLWPLYLVRTLAVMPYFGSGFSKLLDPDWRSGLVTYDRVLRYRHHLDASPAPDWLRDLVTSESFHALFGKLAIGTELFLVAALFPRRTRYFAVWIAIVFHLTIELSARVQVFSWLAVAATLIWVVPATNDRSLRLRVDRPLGRTLARLVPKLDWLERFRLSTIDLSGAPPGAEPAVCVVDRDGRMWTSWAALGLVFSRCPATAFFALPSLLLPLPGRPPRDLVR